MDEMGIDVAIVGVQLADRQTSRGLARRCNEQAAAMMAKHPRRFGAFASVPMPDIDDVLAEMLYSGIFAATPGVRYIFSHAGGTIPWLAGRFAIVDEMRIMPDTVNRGTAAETFRRLYWNTALAWTDPVLYGLRRVAGMRWSCFRGSERCIVTFNFRFHLFELIVVWS